MGGIRYLSWTIDVAPDMGAYKSDNPHRRVIMESQEKKVLAYMKSHNGITSYEAFMNLRITRLSGRIKDLRDKGYVISSDWEGNGDTRYVRYHLIKEGEHPEP